MTIKEETFDIGHVVLCDMCDREYTTSSEVGGITFGSKAVCPKCAPGVLADAAKFEETHHLGPRALPGETFRDFVYRLRGVTGSGKITITTVETPEELLEVLNRDAEH